MRPLALCVALAMSLAAAAPLAGSSGGARAIDGLAA